MDSPGEENLQSNPITIHQYQRTIGKAMLRIRNKNNWSDPDPIDEEHVTNIKVLSFFSTIANVHYIVSNFHTGYILFVLSLNKLKRERKG